MLWVLAQLVLGTAWAAGLRYPGTPANVSRSFDCASRQHAWEFAKATMPARAQFRTVFDALQLEACGLPAPPSNDSFDPPRDPPPPGSAVLYADPAASPDGDGSVERPFASLERAVAAASALAGAKTVVLRGGVYYVRETLLVRSSDLTVQNFPGEHAVISGAVPVKVSLQAWSLHNASTNTWRLDLSGQQLPKGAGLRVGRLRAIRAKYPNGDPETTASYCDNQNVPYGPGRYVPGSGRSMRIPAYFARAHQPPNETTEYWARPSDWPGVVWQEFGEPGMMMQGAGGYGAWFHAQGGICSGRTPDYGYWCSTSCPRSQHGAQPAYNPPGGFLYESNNSLPQAATYHNASGAVFHARGGTNPYFSYMCLVDHVDTQSKTVQFSPSVGCDQGGPTTASGAAWDWFVEDVKEECDAPNEYFHDQEEQALYYTFNSSERPSGREQLALTNTKILFNISGTMSAPVRNFVLRGLTLRDTALTYLGNSPADVQYLASAGDWAVSRSGAVTLGGVENCRIEDCEFTRIDGNAISLNNYARNTSFVRNEFSFLGESAMVAFGSTSSCLYANCSVRLPGEVGPDGRSGNQPRGTLVAGNLVREIGIWQKQSSCWAQQLVAATILESNIFFNTPRAAVNFNEAFGGGDVLRGNLIFNHNRETAEQGPINAWERAPYITDDGLAPDPTSNETPSLSEILNGATPGFRPAAAGSVIGRYRRLEHNFILANYNSFSAMQTDDGSSRYLMTNNYMVYGMVVINSAMVHGNWLYHVGSVHAYPKQIGTGWAGGGAHTYVYNATIIMRETPAVWCNEVSTAVFNNTIHSDYGNAVPASKFGCTGSGNSFESSLSDSDITSRARLALLPFPKPFKDII